MKFISQSHVIEHVTPDVLQHIERAGRTCYKSEDRITPDSAAAFVRRLITSHHESVIEHASMTVRFVTNRGVTHELVRHRLGSSSQESTRYVRYEGHDMMLVAPVWCDELELEQARGTALAMDGYIREATDMLLHASNQIDVFVASGILSEFAYLRLLSLGWTPQQAREVLPNSLRTEIVVTANMREWRHIFRERTSRAAHPQMRALMVGLLADAKIRVPIIFDDLEVLP